MKIYVEDQDVRAVKGGTGMAKTGGNYAASLRAGDRAEAKGYSQVLWLDGVHRKYIEEVGSMNVMFKVAGKILTPDLNGSVLDGITRRSCIQLLKDDEASVAVFPEGYTSKDGKLHHFRSGVFKIAQKANVPIVVCTIQNTRQIFRNVTHLKPTDVELHLLGVIPAEDLKGKTTVDIGNQVYEMMIGDLGESFRMEEA